MIVSLILLLPYAALSWFWFGIYNTAMASPPLDAEESMFFTNKDRVIIWGTQNKALFFLLSLIGWNLVMALPTILLWSFGSKGAFIFIMLWGMSVFFMINAPLAYLTGRLIKEILLSPDRTGAVAVICKVVYYLLLLPNFFMNIFAQLARYTALILIIVVGRLL